MAVSLGVFSSFLAGDTSSLTKSSSSLLSYPRLGLHQSVPPSQVNLRSVRTVTSATASKPATDAGKREPRGIMKPRRVSPEMQAFLGGVPEIPRTQALKLIWAYIKQHNLQDPENKKVIICDENLKKIFAGRDRVGFLEIAGLMNPHFLK
ncbi:Protein TRI1 [Camellia lanceoleosa]|uniref:Protein TRI1 n=1 Tax=Camellia lanceoleosa TaxID=1840588 RepID=A0ACC0FUK7_9ERIC|nr:Protein TRI1 [Camellia lanceoleosa]